MTKIMRIDEWVKVNSPKWTTTISQSGENKNNRPDAIKKILDEQPKSNGVEKKSEHTIHKKQQIDDGTPNGKNYIGDFSDLDRPSGKRSSFSYNGYPVMLVSNDTEKAMFYFGTCEITVNKKSKFDSDSRYLVHNGIYYENIGFDVTDGEAIYTDCTMAYHTDQYGHQTDEAPEHINDEFYITFPKLQQILTNKEEFERAVTYISNWGGTFDEFLKQTNDGVMPQAFTLDLSYFFEGYFFNYLDDKLCKIVDVDIMNV